jgi:hypothetical protein
MDGDTEEYIYHIYDEALTSAQLTPSNSSYVISSTVGRVSGTSTDTNNSNQRDWLPSDNNGGY